MASIRMVDFINRAARNQNAQASECSWGRIHVPASARSLPVCNIEVRSTQPWQTPAALSHKGSARDRFQKSGRSGNWHKASATRTHPARTASPAAAEKIERLLSGQGLIDITMKTLLLTFAVFTHLPCMAQEKQAAPEAEMAAQQLNQEMVMLTKGIHDQEAAVEKARVEMLKIMKRHKIVDLQPAPAAPPESPLSAELEALHAKAEPAQQAEFERWLDHSLTVCTEDAAFRQAYISLLQQSTDLAILKAGGLGERHAKVIALESSVKVQRKQLSALAAQRRDRLRKELIDGVKASEESPPAIPSADEYRKAKQEYEAAAERLKSLREEIVKKKLDTPLPDDKKQ